MRFEPPPWPTIVLLWGCLSCRDGSASEGSPGGQDTGEEGAEEGADEGVDPGPDGPGCGEAWEGWWSEGPGTVEGELSLAMPEGAPQLGRWRARGAINVGAKTESVALADGESFRATLIAHDSVLSTGRNLAVSWCLGNILPYPQGPGGVIDEEEDEVNLERYEVFRAGLEQATRIWERHTRMNFIHLASLDDRRKPSGGTCDTALEQVWFRAQTQGCNNSVHGATNASGDNEFDPATESLENPEGYPRLLCLAFQFLQAEKTRVPVYAAHESGHIVGLQHEHVRWDQADNHNSNCKENDPMSSGLPI